MLYMASIILQQCFQEQDAVTREDHNLRSLVLNRLTWLALRGGCGSRIDT